ncbi:NAD(P)/FAD-dependent oxidoreductase [Leucobacter allii]|uniref:NAD(P)/FAD-dependent oxidoreductase n=1 Tax=Leucobacter allii TaxID=2932247 RepID=A0ABY4FPW2_9MICO|nr:NAD(P)/FAD-dependent oxidoreductase [Leucobacter allii]UOQ58324.1 NAD(P)/FAD-dependent oxidoreductase [Leucobacter allii]UOR02903.1 NAD(P)/FAD-dependent oxidoreductase [Leucobacter allii]
MAAEDRTAPVGVAIIGGGPAGLSAGLQLVRANRRIAILDSNRPRHSATLRSHGFLTRDGISPLELRRLGREEFEAYPSAITAQAVVREVLPLAAEEALAVGFPDGIGFRVRATGIRGAADETFVARRVLLAAGLTEELPALPMIRAYYGTALHSCVECDGFEKSDEPLALIGETTDVFSRALLISRFSSDLIVFTNGADTIRAEQEAQLAGIGVRVERRAIDDIVGEKAEMTGVRLADGEVIPRVGGFVRPRWHAPVEFLGELPIARDAWGLVSVDARGESSIRGVYAVGDIVPPGPQQLIIAAGNGARVAAKLNLDMIRGALGVGRVDD